MGKRQIKEKWKPNFNKWYDVELPAYKFIYEQAEKRMEDVLSNSEAITDNSIKILTGVTAMFSFFIGFLIKKDIPFDDNYFSIVLFIANMLLALFLIFPKEVRPRGIAPRTLLPKRNLDDEEDRDFQEQILYYSAIEILQDNIDFMRRRNSVRAIVYLAALLLGLFLLLIGTEKVITYL